MPPHLSGRGRVAAVVVVLVVATAGMGLGAAGCHGHDGVALASRAGGGRALEGGALVLDKPELAGISGFRELWDVPVVLADDGVTEPAERTGFGRSPRAVWSPANAKREGGKKPGAIVFDALQRQTLVRFPDAAEAIADVVASHQRIVRIELVLTYRDTELWPEGYLDPAGLSFLGDLWSKNPPRWHAVANVVRKPWIADAAHGPTFNAFANGVANAYWKTFGAADVDTDRFPADLGPAEVSKEVPEGHLDVTAVVTDAAYGVSLGERLRVLADNGFALRKLETYDARYMRGGYEWGTPTGGRGVLIGAPKLVVTFEPDASATRPTVPPSVRPEAVAAARAVSGDGARPTAVMPTADELRAYAEKFAFRKPEGMPDWAWARLTELNAAGGAWSFPATPDAYAKWIDTMLATPARRWDGFTAADNLEAYYHFASAWPAPVRETWKRYWKAWLMPDRDVADMVQPWSQVKEILAYYDKTNDFRGNTTFYRPYSVQQGTMNFNHMAVAGSLLGGAIIDSPRAMKDGRFGLEAFPLRMWTWFDGSSQESIDHYYFGISLKHQKLFYDYGPTRMDRMMGGAILAKSVEELASAFHPGLRRFIAPSARTGLAYLFATQDGPSHILHTLSRQGALTDLREGSTAPKTTVAGMHVFGDSVSPGLVAEEARTAPWGDALLSAMVDGKPIPYESTATYKRWGAFAKSPLLRRSYLGKSYGVASQDVPMNDESVPVMAQWRTGDATVEHAEELATLTCRFGVNTVNFVDTLHIVMKDGKPSGRNPNGVLGTDGGYPVTLQHKNKMIVATSPLKGLAGVPPTTPVTSIKTALALFKFDKSVTPDSISKRFTIRVDGQPRKLPIGRLRAGQRITIAEGATYIGIIPLPSKSLGRTDEVRIVTDTGPVVELQGGGHGRPALVIEQMNFEAKAPLSDAIRASDDLDKAYGGFVVELGDAAEYGSFDAFDRHLRSAKLHAALDGTKTVFEIAYTSGRDLLELGFRPVPSGAVSPQGAIASTDQLFAYRRVNGAWPYLPTDVDRETSLSMITKTGRVEKNGAVLTTSPGATGYVQTAPDAGLFEAFNPFPEPSDFAFTVPSGLSLTADGKLGIARVLVDVAHNTVAIEHAAREGAVVAKTMTLRGAATPPKVTVNGAPAELTARDGAFVVSLGDATAP